MGVPLGVTGGDFGGPWESLLGALRGSLWVRPGVPSPPVTPPPAGAVCVGLHGAPCWRCAWAGPRPSCCCCSYWPAWAGAGPTPTLPSSRSTTPTCGWGTDHAPRGVGWYGGAGLWQGVANKWRPLGERKAEVSVRFLEEHQLLPVTHQFLPVSPVPSKASQTFPDPPSSQHSELLSTNTLIVCPHTGGPRGFFGGSWGWLRGSLGGSWGSQGRNFTVPSGVRVVPRMVWGSPRGAWGPWRVPEGSSGGPGKDLGEIGGPRGSLGDPRWVWRP